MAINEMFGLLLALVGGYILGIFFFYGLWITLEKVTISKFPISLLFFSGVLRVAVTIYGLYLIAMLYPDEQIIRLFLALLGFLFARMTISKMTDIRSRDKHES